MARKSDRLILLIGAFKLVKALLLIVLGVFMLAMDHDQRVAEAILAIRPGSGLVTKLFAKILETSPTHRTAMGLGSIVYASVFVVEGIGLLRRRRWAEYLTVIITTSFIPFEIYEMIARGSLVKAAIMVANIGVVIYLILRLRGENAERREHAREEQQTHDDRVEHDREKIEATLRSPRTPSASGAARV